MSQPTTRVLAMLELLQAHHRLGGRDLADRLGVDERTVRRYAARLADLGIPVTAERGRYGGYRLLPGYRLPPLMLTDDEATAAVLGLRAARRLGLVAGAADAALAKILRVLPVRLRDEVGALEETLDFTLAERAGAAPASRAVLTLAAAIRDRRRVTLRYRSWKGEETQRDLDGHGLVFHSGRWYVTGHDHRSGESRTFRVDRIASVTPGAATYDIPEDSDPVGHVISSLARVPYTHTVKVILHVPLAEAARRIPPSIAELTAAPDGTLLTMRAESLDGAATMLVGLGYPFTITSPDELRASIRHLAEKLLDQSRDPGGPHPRHD